MKKTIICALLLYSSISYPGLNGLTHHSRANCVSINESISWDKTKDWHVKVFATHFPPDQEQPHTLRAEGTGWRIAALHANEGYGGWLVHAEHYFRMDDNMPWNFRTTMSSDCNFYSGWRVAEKDIDKEDGLL